MIFGASGHKSNTLATFIMPPQVETRHHLPLETLQPYLVRSLASTIFSPTSSSQAGSSGGHNDSKRTGWGELKKVKQFSVSGGRLFCWLLTGCKADRS